MGGGTPARLQQRHRGQGRTQRRSCHPVQGRRAGTGGRAPRAAGDRAGHRRRRTDDRGRPRQPHRVHVPHPGRLPAALRDAGRLAGPDADHHRHGRPRALRERGPARRRRPAWPCSASSWGSWRRPCSAWPSARWWAGWPAGPSGSTTSRSRGHRPARSRSCPGPSRSSPATGASRRRRSCSGSASTRSPRTPCSASPTSGPSWSSSCATTPAGSVPTRAPSASGSGPSTSAAPTPSASCSSSSAIPRSCWAPSARPSRSACAPGSDALIAVVVGFVDHTVDRAAAGLMSGGGQIAEAVRRRRLEAGSEDVFLERLLGLSLTRAEVERGRAFVSGVIEREGDEGLSRLWRSARALPTPPGGRRPRSVAGPPRGRRGRATGDLRFASAASQAPGGGRSSWSLSARRRSFTLERTRAPGSAAVAGPRGCAATPRRRTRARPPPARSRSGSPRSWGSG